MPHADPECLRAIKTLPQLLAYLRDELDWPIEIEDIEDLTFEYQPQELGLDTAAAVKIKEIKQLRPLTGNQPWGIFFINFEKKSLPVVILRRILRALVLKKRASANKAERQSWQPNDLMFISAYGDDTDRAITFAHFVENEDCDNLAELRVLGWDDDDTPLKYDYIAHTLQEKLRWRDEFEENHDLWRQNWREAFVLRHREVITTSKELALALAALAKRIRGRVRSVLRCEDGFGQIRKLQRAFRQGLIHDLTDDDFADMLAQTVTYGLFSVAVRRTFPGEGTAVVRDDVPNLIFTSPFLKDMMGIFLGIKSRKGRLDFDELGVTDVEEVLRSPDTHMEAVLRDFGNRTRQEDPVIHFYELFLTEYDKKRKVQRGVFYTPQPVVSYIVRSAHELLQTEFGLEDGLASTITWGEMIKKQPDLKLPDLSDDPAKPKLLSLDEPFVQILDPATGTGTFLVEVIDVIYKTMVAKWNKAGKSDAQMKAAWNDYVPKNLLPRVYGYELMMAPYAIAHMKIGLKLSETGYRFRSDERARIYLTNALEPKVTQLPPIGFEALAHEAKEVNEVKWYKRFTVVIGNPPYSFRSTNKSDFIMNLLEDYRKGLNEKKPQLNDDYVKFLRLAQYILSAQPFGILAMITNNSYLYGVTHWRMRESLCESFSIIRILDLGGDMKFHDIEVDDENVFDIQQGVCIGVFLRKPASSSKINYLRIKALRDEKSRILSGVLPAKLSFDSLEVKSPFYFTKNSLSAVGDYLVWPSITEIFPAFINGIITSRDDFCLDVSRARLKSRLEDFASLDIGKLLKKYTEIDLRDNTSVDIRTAKSNIQKHPAIVDDCITKCAYRPFDVRYLAFDTNFIHRTREAVMKHLLRDNIALVFNRSIRGDIPCHFFVVKNVAMKEIISSKDNSYVAPLYLYCDGQNELFVGEARRFNICRNVLNWWKATTGTNESINGELFFGYLYAVFHSPGYRIRYAEFLKIDFPRLPLTSSLDLFRALAKLGGELVALHLMESPKLDKHVTKWGGGKNPEVEKVTYSDETVWIDKAQAEGFKGVPKPVWNFHIGGYQVCEKWLKDRKDRKLLKADIEHYHRIVVALSETIRLMAEIDQVIDAHGGWPIK